MSPSRPIAREGVSVTAAGYLSNETHIVQYAKDMLEHVGADGPFVLNIAKKIHGSEHHHGVEFDIIMNYGVRMKIQSSDNDSRYLCYLRSPQMKPKDILMLLDSKLSNRKYNRDGLRQKAAEPAAVEPKIQVPEPAEKVSLAGCADDEVVVAMFLIAIRLKHGMDAFDAKSFLEIIQKEYVPNARRAAAGQLLRRLVEYGYLSSEGKAPKKTYHFAKKGVELLAEHDQSVAKSASNALKLQDASKLYEELAKLESKARQHGAAAQRLLDVNGKIKEQSDLIDEVQRQLESLHAAREDLRREAAKEQAILDDPELRQAAATYAEIQASLKKG